VLAIGLQESGFTARRQSGGGPARGFWQFEQQGGVEGVLRHPATRRPALSLCNDAAVLPFASNVHRALEFHDGLACAFARLLLLTDPVAITDSEDGGWAMYLRTWRPGKPRAEQWKESWDDAYIDMLTHRYETV
jgi:hypothetical protein